MAPVRAAAALAAVLVATVLTATATASPAAPSAATTVTAVFTDVVTPPVDCVAKTGQYAGQRWCTGAPSRVASFDDTPIDVSVFLPPATGGTDGDYPLVGIYHGWGGTKAGGGTAQSWLAAGYAVFSMTARGWWDSCGTAASRADPPEGTTCEAGDVGFIDYRYEARDAQYLIGLLVDEGVVDPERIGAFGGSYGGMVSSTLAALNTRTVTGVDATGEPVYTRWTSPDGVPLHIAGAAPGAVNADLAYSQVPNGSALDYVADSPYFTPNGRARVGVQKAGVMNGFLGSVGGRATLGPDIRALQDAANGPGPYDDLEPAVRALAATHGALNVDASITPAPMFVSDGWNDDFVGADEAIKLYNRVRAEHPEVPVAMYLGDVGHPRSQDKAGDEARLEQLRRAWMDHYVLDGGAGAAPAERVYLNAFTCAADSGEADTLRSWADASAGEVRIRTSEHRTVAASGSEHGEQFFGPDTTACAEAPATNDPDAASYRTPKAKGSGYDLRGGAMLYLRLKVTGESDQLAVRLLDVAPDGTERLVERGLLRPAVDKPEKLQYLQLHPSWWHVARGHRLKLELLPDDAPYSHLNTTTGGDGARQHPIVVRYLELRVPTMQPAGASRGLVKKARSRWLPPGFDAAPGFTHSTTTTPPG